MAMTIIDSQSFDCKDLCLEGPNVLYIYSNQLRLFGAKAFPYSCYYFISTSVCLSYRLILEQRFHGCCHYCFVDNLRIAVLINEICMN